MTSMAVRYASFNINIIQKSNYNGKNYMRLRHLAIAAQAVFFRNASAAPTTTAASQLRRMPTILVRKFSMQASQRLARLLLVGCGAVLATGCGTISAMNNLADGAGAESMTMWDRWVDSNGDIAVATTWERKVKTGVTIEQIEAALASIAVEDNMRSVGDLPLSKELEARSGKKEKFLKVYSYCSPATARIMVDFSPHMAAYLPCRISVVERDDGLWMYTLNMDMMVRMGRKLPPELQREAMKVRNTLWKMMEGASKGDF
jgi:uncharacterized protein (DUF302 family)